MKPTKGDKTRRYLLEVTAQFYAQHGVNKVTVRALAAAARMSPGTITHYFPKISDLFPEVIKHIFEKGKIETRDQTLRSSEEQLAFIVKMNFDFFVITNPHYYKCLLLSYYFIGVDQRITTIHKSSLEFTIRSVETLLRQTAAQRNMPQTDLESMAKRIVERIEGGLLFCSFLTKTEERRQYAKHLLADHQMQLEEFFTP